MNIIEARKLAEQGKTVIGPDGKEYTSDDFQEVVYTPWMVFDEWREKKEPRRVFLVMSESGEARISHWIFNTREEAASEMGPGRRIVEFVEVVK